VESSCERGNKPSGPIKCRESTEWLHPHVYDFITKLCRQQAEVIQNHDNENVRNIGQGEAPHRKYKRLKLGAVTCTTVQVSKSAVVALATTCRA
jgi:hypothetical protein